MFRPILVAFDGSVSARRALDMALSMVQSSRAKLSLVSVEEHLPYFAADIGEVKDEKEQQNHYFAQIQREAREAAKLRGMDFHRADILTGHVAQSILNHARAIACDLIVIGHSGRSGVWANFLGSTADKVMRHAHCSVLVVR